MSVPLTELIRQHLDEAGEATAEEISVAIDRSREAVFSTCSTLVSRGELMRSYTGEALVFAFAPWMRPSGDEVVASALKCRAPLELAWSGVAQCCS